jgi:hypothetical protein
MLKEIIKVVDTDGDGKIQYEGWHCPRPCPWRSIPGLYWHHAHP